MSDLGLREVRSLPRVTYPNTRESGCLTLAQSKVLQFRVGELVLWVKCLRSHGRGQTWGLALRTRWTRWTSPLPCPGHKQKRQASRPHTLPCSHWQNLESFLRILSPCFSDRRGEPRSWWGLPWDSRLGAECPEWGSDSVTAELSEECVHEE